MIHKLLTFKNLFFFILITTTSVSFLFRIQKFAPFSSIGEIYSDRAGYYVYLPATFTYHFKADERLKVIEKKVGTGFSITKNGKIATKYPYGTALLISPFWVSAYLLNLTGDGFNLVSHKVIDLAGYVYFLLTLFIMFKTLSLFYEDEAFKYKVLTFFTFGTNLFFWGSIDLGMSHIYSAFAVAVFFYHWLLFLKDRQYKNLLFTAFALGLIFIIRQIDILFISFFIFWGVSSLSGFRERLWLLLSPKIFSTFLIVGVLMTLPQFIYNYFIYDSILMKGYDNEKFCYLDSPKIGVVLFSLKCGIFTYAPMLVFSVLPLCFKNNWQNFNFTTWIYVPFWFLFVYLYSSWWCYELGRPFGYRTLVNFSPVLIIPFAAFFQKYRNEKKLNVLGILMMFYVLNLSFACIGEYYKSDNPWDWDEFSSLLVQPVNIVKKVIISVIHR